MPSKTADGPKRRNATNACAACKRAKLRCKLPEPGSKEQACERCRARGTPCVLAADLDLRAARTSLKAHVDTLQARIDELEARLAAAGLSTATNVPSSNGQGSASPLDSAVPPEEEDELTPDLDAGQGELMVDENGELHWHDERVPWDVSCLKFTKAAAVAESDAFLPVPLPNELHASLLDLAFRFFFNTHRMVELDQFLADLNKGRRSWFYSPFLHLSILATGCNYVHNPPPALCSDPSDPSTRGEPFAQAALDLLNAELTNPRFSTIQGLMILAKWMSGAKQPHKGWIYAGIANRLCSDFGLHLDLPAAPAKAYQPGLREMRQKLFWACSTYEITWSACIGRPSEFAADLARQPPLPLDGTAWPYMTQLHRIAFKVYDLNWGAGGKGKGKKERVEMVKALEGELEKWYESVPPLLRWETSPMNDPDMLDLNVNYRQTLILLHKPFLIATSLHCVDPPSTPSASSIDSPAPPVTCSVLALQARKALTAACAEVARIGEKYNTEVGLRWVPNCVLQAFFHAGAVSLQLSLLSSVPHSPEFSAPPNPAPFLADTQSCIDALEEMSHTWSTAGFAAKTLEGMRSKVLGARSQPVQPATGTGTGTAPVQPQHASLADSRLLLSLGETSFRDGLRSPPSTASPAPPSAFSPHSLASHDRTAQPFPPGDANFSQGQQQPPLPIPDEMTVPLPIYGFPAAFAGVDGAATVGVTWPWEGMDAPGGGFGVGEEGGAFGAGRAEGLGDAGGGVGVGAGTGGTEWLTGGKKWPFQLPELA
ncbi:hypothetical protein JCM6882_008884 [Rhodosporidiobolus microsporus]